jgi:uncharacterized delta-60 repeat protein
MRRLLSFLALFFIATGPSASLAAAPGALDRSFGAGFGYIRYADSTNTVSDQGLGVAAQADGKVLVAGTSGIDKAAIVVRFNADGTPDEGFATRGVFRWKPADDFASAKRVVVLPSGKLLVVGYLGTAAKLLLLRLDADGALDPTFGTNGITVATATGWKADARRVLLDDRDGFVVVWETIDPALNRIRVSRYTPAGLPDPEYNYGAGETLLDTAGFGAVTTLPFDEAFDPLGRLVIFASTYNASANTTLIYRLDRNGFPDATFGDDFRRVVVPQPNFAFFDHAWTVLSAQGTGYVLVEWMPNGVRFQKFNLDGTIAQAFGSFGLAEFPFAASGVAPGNALLQSDGTIVVTGTSRFGGANHVFVLAVTASGQLDTRFGTTTPQRTSVAGRIGNDIARVPGGDELVVGGTTLGAGSEDVLALRLDARAVAVPSFGDAGATAWDGSDVIPESARGIWVQQGGRILTLNAARTTAVPDTATKWNWRRFLPDGNPDTSFGAGGKRPLADVFDGPNLQIYTQGDGRIVVARQAVGPEFTNRTRIIRYNTDGSRDLGFGIGGAVDLIDDAQADQTAARPGIVQTDDGKLLVATYGSGGLHLRRLLASGNVDPDFGGGNARVYPPLDGRPQIGYALAVQSDGRILVGASKIVVLQAPLPQATVHADVVVRVLPDGTLDPTYGLQGGVVPIQIENARDPQILRILPLPDGKAIVAGNIAHLGAEQFFFLRLNANGTIDTTYGDHTDGGDGPGPFIWSDIYQTRMNDVVLDAAGRLVITGEYVTPPGTRTTAFVVRFLANGTVDGPFGGINQHIFFLDRPEPTGAGNAIALGTNAIFVGGDSGSLGLVFKLEAEGSALIKSEPVIEFYNTQLNHYFITADAAEAAGIDQGAAGPGWQRTGRGFRAWTAASGVPNSQVAGIPFAATPVCRFYGTPGIGPNSHFYTVDLAECDAVRNDPGWHYEGIAFFIIAPTPTDQSCPSSTLPVLRAYNDRFAQNDSNHRYTTNPAVLQAMVQQGWSAEGVVFCAPN